MKNRGKKIMLASTIILIIYGIILSAVGLLYSENLGLTWWFARLSIFLAIFSTTILLVFIFLNQKNDYLKDYVKRIMNMI